MLMLHIKYTIIYFFFLFQVKTTYIVEFYFILLHCSVIYVKKYTLLYFK